MLSGICLARLWRITKHLWTAGNATRVRTGCISNTKSMHSILNTVFCNLSTELELGFCTLTSSPLRNMLALSVNSSGTVCAIHWWVSGDGLWRALPVEATALDSCMALQIDSHMSSLYWLSGNQMGDQPLSSCSCLQQTPAERIHHLNMNYGNTTFTSTTIVIIVTAGMVRVDINTKIMRRVIICILQSLSLEWLNMEVR